MTLLIFEQREPPTRRPFRLVEVTYTVDGPRSRVAEKSFTTCAEARAFVATVELKKAKVA